jgi:Concanavalin A-like lectin/glucanases superfamily
MVTRIPARMIETTGVTPGSYSAADITVNSAGQITSASTSSVASSGGGPKITSIVVTDSSYTNIDDTAVGLSGGYIKVTGTGFVSGCSIIIGSLVATSVSFINSTEVRAQVPAQSAGTYTVYLVNSDGGVGIRVNGLNYSSTPTWTTTSPLGDGSIDTAISVQFVATSNSTVTYALEAGSTLPAGLSLSSGGLLSGIVTGITVDTTYNFTIVATDQESQDTPQAFSITITVSDPNFKNTVLLLQADIAPTIISDASTNNFDLTVAGDTRASNFTPYGTGWSVYFDGTGDYLSIPSNAAFAFGTGDFTIEFWFYPTTGSARNITFPITGAPIIYMNGSRQLQFETYGAPPSVTTTNTLNLNAWNHCAVSRASGTVKVFVNGVTGVTSTAFSATNFVQSSVNIGTDAGTNFATGFMSDVRITKGGALYTADFTPSTTPLTTTVSAGTVSLLTCNANRFLDSSSNGFAITRNGDAKVVSFNPFGITNTGVNGSMYFDGTGDYCTTSGNAAFALGTGDFCLETWIYPNSISTGTFDRIVATSDYNGSGFDWTLNTASSALYVAGTAYSISNLAIKSWNHLVYTRSGGILRGFLNGNLAVYNASATGNVTSTGELRIGTGYSGTAYNGYISNLRIVKGSVPAAYQTSSTTINTTVFSPPTTLLTAVTGTSLLTLQYDQPPNNHTFLDSSSNQFLITRNGNTTQGTFSPFSHSGHSVYFDGTGDYLSIPTNTAFDLPGDFTIEYWVYVVPLAGNSNYHIITRGYYQSGAQDWLVAVGADYNAFMAWGNPSTGSSAGFITPNTWFHIAFARSGTTLRAFKNGVLSNSITTSVNLTNTQAVNIGTNSANSANNLMSGYISNLRIIKGTALYTTNFTPSTTPLTSVANTSLLACHANRFIDGSANNFTVTRNGDTRITAFGPFSTTAYSATSNGGSAYFDGTGDYLTVPHDPAVVLNNEDWTIEFWVYPTVDARADVICKGNGGSYVPYMISLLTSGQINFNTSNSGSTHAILLYSNTGDYRLFQWNHIAVTKSGSTIRIFCQGALVATGSYSGGAMTNSLPLGIGAGSDGVQRLTGYMSHVRIIKGTALYTSAFTVPTAPPTATTNTSLLLNFTDAAIRDGRGLAVLETVGDAKVSTVQVKYGTGSMRFDGTGDYLVPYNPNTNTYAFGSNDFTIEFWVRFGALAGNQIIYDSRPSATDGLYPMIYANGTSLRYYVNAVDRITSGTLSTNVWYHVAVARSGTSTKMFIDGTQAGSTYTDSTVYINATNRPLIAQNGTNLGAALNGYIDDLRVTTGVARYTANFTPPTTKFLAR